MFGVDAGFTLVPLLVYCRQPQMMKKRLLKLGTFKLKEDNRFVENSK